jgi:hypothetical protein
MKYRHAVVISPGTEFISGTSFFVELDKLISKDFFVAGHILDRGDAYYELHHQCYVVNLEYYKELNFPFVGKQELRSRHSQIAPVRSTDNFHDDYTPLWITTGTTNQVYEHKCHGWNILQTALSNNKTCIIFDNNLRNSKKHHYPESKKDFQKSLPWLYFKNDFCSNEFVHTDNTEKNKNIFKKFDQIVLPASGTLYLDLIEEGNVVFYDYNQKSLDYWKETITYNKKISYSFVKTNLLIDNILLDHIDKNATSTLINLSNIFCYEGTASLYPLVYRFNRQYELINSLKTKISNVDIVLSTKAECGFTEKENPVLEDLKRPTWHYNQDWT